MEQSQTSSLPCSEPARGFSLAYSRGHEAARRIPHLLLLSLLQPQADGPGLPFCLAPLPSDTSMACFLS